MNISSKIMIVLKIKVFMMKLCFKNGLYLFALYVFLFGWTRNILVDRTPELTTMEPNFSYSMIYLIKLCAYSKYLNSVDPYGSISFTWEYDRETYLANTEGKMKAIVNFLNYVVLEIQSEESFDIVKYRHIRLIFNMCMKNV